MVERRGDMQERTASDSITGYLFADAADKLGQAIGRAGTFQGVIHNVEDVGRCELGEEIVAFKIRFEEAESPLVDKKTHVVLDDSSIIK